jgi:sigma-B regulation protein RsbU (phosphoserine phosphatase)
VLERIQPVLRQVAQWFGWVGAVFVVTFLAWSVFALTGQISWTRTLLGLAVLVTGFWLFLRGFRVVAKILVWRLRHRLIVTYLFIAVAPVVLLSAIALTIGYFLVSQVAMNVVSTEVERREEELNNLTATIAKLDPANRAREMLRVLDPYFTQRYPGLVVVVRQQDRTTAFPQGGQVPNVTSVEQPEYGVVSRGSDYFLWSHRPMPDGGVTLAAPLSHALLDTLAPTFGIIEVAKDPRGVRPDRPLPPAVNDYDQPMVWFATLSAGIWDKPAQRDEMFSLVLETRLFTAMSAIFGRQADAMQETVRVLLIAGLIIFLIVEIICWIIGVSMTRTITGAVHHIYEGTQKVTEGHLSHRIAVEGKDQLADVGASFNRMTAHLEQLVLVEKEKERMQADLEIAKQVQAQLYPQLEPRTEHLSVAATCRPARMVSGDYFDYESAGDGHVALAIGDVSGKGISAALLMASLQSSLRTQLQSKNGRHSTAAIVSRLNRHLCASTTPDKYATFCLGVYDEATNTLTYTNAGHLPPALIRQGQGTRLDVNGTIVGCFPHVSYEESSVRLEPGDLLLCFTDGISELENAFGEMYGEDRLIELVAKNAHLSEQRIIDLIVDAAHEWCGSHEMQDDLTLLVVRRL